MKIKEGKSLMIYNEKQKFYRIIFPIIIAGLLMNGCNNNCQTRLKTHGMESIKMDIKENRDVYFFECSKDFYFDNEILQKIEGILKKARGESVDNVAFTFISNRSIPFEIQEKTRKLMYEIMHKYHFLRSRIIDAGICVYDGAKTGVRIDILQYEITQPDCSMWSENIGDLDNDKDLPKYGASAKYNMGEMIANKADFISPREYPGQEVRSAIASASSGDGGAAAPAAGK
jgi:type IV pilus biogenesis protein CpaD/CtpE